MNVVSDLGRDATFDILGLDIAVTDLGCASQDIINWAKDTQGRFVCVRDVHGVMLSDNSLHLKSLHRDAAMITPDGMPLVWLGRLAGHKVGRACGADLMENIIDQGQARQIKHYFFGGAAGVAEMLANTFGKKHPNALIVGHESPPFRAFSNDENAAMISRIKASGADIVWVGMSTPKQEFWMHSVYKSLPVTLIGVGAAFDFHSGKVNRAPRWMQKSGLEWLHRLGSEPRRLWRRYLILAPKFTWKVLRKKAAIGKIR
ncbi:MAG: WecB/TagA/CpsF family glycosyltransferase [Rhodobacteraceae bacterium]|nr:WecB/TagA/CpsF family glycosyltransferase [Paracoccaceae bacterium]